MSPRSKKERFPVKGQRKPWAVNRSLGFLIMNNSLEHSRHVHACTHAHNHTQVSLRTDSQLATDQERNSRPSYQSSILPSGTVWLSLCGRHPTSFPVQRGYCSAGASKAPCCLGAPDGNQMCGSGMHRLSSVSSSEASCSRHDLTVGQIRRHPRKRWCLGVCVQICS